MRFDFTPLWLEHLLDPSNPLFDWVPIILLTVFAAHMFAVYWVYRDALGRYNRGAPWALATALVPLGGWLFYVFYRTSPLVEFDRIEAELFDESDHEWNAYDEYKQHKGGGLFKELGTMIRTEAGGYSEKLRASRFAETRRRLSPEERADVALLRKQRRLDARKSRAARIAALRDAKRQRRVARREGEKLAGQHGSTLRLSERRQRAVRKQLHVMEQLREMPRIDAALEELIYEMRYGEALEQARGNLAVAREMNDRQGTITAEAYIGRLERLLADEVES